MSEYVKLRTHKRSKPHLPNNWEQDARSHDMTLNACWERYLYMQDDCVEAVYWCRQHGETPEYVALKAATLSLAAIVFHPWAPFPIHVPVFPWAPKPKVVWEDPMKHMPHLYDAATDKFLRELEF